MNSGVGPADHRVELARGWDIWRTTALRGTGFPFRLLDALVSNETFEAASAFLERRDAFERQCKALLDACVAALPGESKTELRQLRKAIKRLRRHEAPESLSEREGLQEHLSLLKSTLAARQAAQETLATMYDQAMQRALEKLRATGSDPLFREALLWQNPSVIKTALEPLQRHAGRGMDSDDRQHGLLLARYLQRYCSKNETIGFFGPVAWARIGDEPKLLQLRPGADLVAGRETHFEFRAIQALADRLAADPRVRPWVAPRLSPAWRITPEYAFGPGGQRLPMTEVQYALLQHVDGQTAAIELPARLGLAGDAAVAEVLQFLGALAEAGIVIWRLALPVVPRPERYLQRALESIGEPTLREAALAGLDSLVQARNGLATAAGDPAKLSERLSALQAEFTRLTGNPAQQQKRGGQAGRALVYEDCVRDVDCRLGQPLLEHLGAPLALVLRSARWFTRQLARQYSEFVRAEVASLAREQGASGVPLERVWRHLQEQHDIVLLIIDDVVEQLTEAWSGLLLAGAAPGTRVMEWDSTDLQQRVKAVFPAEAPGWHGARYHSPDIMIAAASADDIRDDEFLLVLGELHAAWNTLLQQIFLDLHPAPDHLLADVALDQPEPELVAVPPGNMGGHRRLNDPGTPHDMHFEYDGTPSWRSQDQVLPIAELLVEVTDKGLEVRTRDGSRRFPGSAFFGPQLRSFCARRFRLLPALPHTPRVVVDRLVINRETWRFDVQELAFASATAPLERYAGFCSFAAQHSFQRWTFVRTHREKKPVYVDLHSPMLVEVAMKLVRAAAGDEAGWVSISEMLPSPEQLWLTDGEGERYCSELRTAILDQARYEAEPGLW